MIQCKIREMCHLSTIDFLLFPSFSMNDSTVHEAVSALLKTLGELEDRYVKWANEEDQIREMATFFERTGNANYSSCATG